MLVYILQSILGFGRLKFHLNLKSNMNTYILYENRTLSHQLYNTISLLSFHLEF